MPENLLESELFGHMRGAFTGADSNKKGLLEVAERGTVFLDEIGEMSAVMQVKLLRVLQERRFRRVGGLEEMQADIRVIAATNQDLTQADRRRAASARICSTASTSFRLRCRRCASGARTSRCSRSTSSRNTTSRWGRRSPASRTRRWSCCRQYDWPGNIRELENVMERAVALERRRRSCPIACPPTIRGDAPQVPTATAQGLPAAGFDLEAHVKEIERGYIAEALKQAGGVQVKAAELLGMSFRRSATT